VLGRQPIIDRGDDGGCTGAQIAAHAVMGVEAAQHETAAVEEHDQRKRAGVARRIEEEAQLSARPSIATSPTPAISAGGAISATRDSAWVRAAASGKVCVAGTPAALSSSVWICGSTGNRLSWSWAVPTSSIENERFVLR
jgi:hypothetical protein